MKSNVSIFAVVLGAFTVLMFQNCGGNAFTNQDLVSIECSSSGCSESLSENAGGTPRLNPSGAENSTGIPSGGSGLTPTEVAEAEAEAEVGAPVASDSSQLFNFVSGSGKSSCESLIVTSKGKVGSCTLGGGCGISCGKPGSGCASANPSYYGACYSQSDLNRLPAKESSANLYNFVAGDKATCEASILKSYGVGKCSVGGGCGVSCGKPGGNCASANPSYYGACYSANELAALPKEKSASKLYNFVAGDKATCEKSVQNILGLNQACKIGGGCGVSCGMPGPSCPSANPQHYGACIQQ